MAIPYSGTFSRSAGLVSALGKQIKLLNLKPVKKLEVQFDPFHDNANAVRDFIFHISGPKRLATNLKCLVRTTVVTDRSEPLVKINLVDNGVIKFKAANLTTLELLQLFNKHISSQVKPEEEQKPAPKTKSAKKR